jgi:hypothetical protein
MTNPLPPGFIPHDGSGCPVPLDSRPGVMFRDGITIDTPVFVSAENWIFPIDKQNFWIWEASGPADIIAYKPDPEYGDAK